MPMKKSKFTEEPIAYTLRESDLATIVAEVSRTLGISVAT